ncbi:MAG: histidine phosphatase family protein [Pseudomonadota bacterium]
MPRIFFIRHGETDWNRAGRLQGSTDIALNALGRTQAGRNGERLRELIGDGAGYRFIASPLSRTVETMRRVRTAMGLAPDVFDREPALVEVGFGAWEGERWVDLRRSSPDGVAAYLASPLDFVPPNGEGYGGARDRALAWLADVRCDTVCVSHGGINRVLRGALLRLPAPEIVHLKVPQDRIMEICRDGPHRGVIWH